jgi:hypothetical protein
VHSRPARAHVRRGRHFSATPEEPAMKKLKLDVEKLEVESFDTKDGEKRRGT